jgi:hypothetical protein
MDATSIGDRPFRRGLLLAVVTLDGWLPFSLSGGRWIVDASLWQSALSAGMGWVFAAWRVSRVFPHWATYRLPNRVALLVLITLTVAEIVVLAVAPLWRERAIVESGVE